jgi:hypothetical protein
MRKDDQAVSPSPRSRSPEALKDPSISDIALGGTWFPEMEPAA